MWAKEVLMMAAARLSETKRKRREMGLNCSLGRKTTFPSGLPWNEAEVTSEAKRGLRRRVASKQLQVSAAASQNISLKTISLWFTSLVTKVLGCHAEVHDRDDEHHPSDPEHRSGAVSSWLLRPRLLGSLPDLAPARLAHSSCLPPTHLSRTVRGRSTFASSLT